MGLTQPDPILAVARQTGISLHKTGRLLLVKSTDCENVLRACEEFGFLILGIDAFRIQARDVVPTDLVADFSSLIKRPFKEACVLAAAAARQFFASLEESDTLWFEFTLEQRH